MLNARNMIWFKALGGTVLYDATGSLVGGAARQRRTIGLLAALTVAGDAGMTRDKLVGLFWPDYAPSKARHSLTQALYAARKALSCDGLFDVSEDIRLNFDCIESDVRAFERKIRADDDEGASALYRGPFLDGFYLASPEFDMWLSHERVRLEDLAVGAIGRVVERLERAESWASAIENARRLTAMRPSDAGFAMSLMRVLARSGDRPAAIAYAQTYAAIIREQHETEPDHAVIELSEQLRQWSGTPLAQSRSVEFVVPVAVEPVLLPATTLRVRAPLDVTRQRGARPMVLLAAMIMLIAVFATGALFLIRRNHTTEVIRPLQQRLIIAPFRVAAADPALQYLSDGLIELLSTRLADDSLDRSMDAGPLIRAWRKAGVTAPLGMTVDTIVEVARRLGAERVIVGSVVGTPQRTILSASVIAVRSGKATMHASVEGSADTLTGLVDQLARKLLLSQAGEDQLSQRTTISLPALRAYVAGTSAYAVGDYAVAEERYTRALTVDSTFALAALKLAMSAARLADFAAERTALDRAWHFRSDLGRRDDAYLHALLGAQYPALSGIRDSRIAWNEAARLNPERPEVWFGLAAATLQTESPSDFVVERDAIVAALRRALELDPGYAQAAILLARVQDRGTAHPSGASMKADTTASFLRWWQATLSGDSAARAESSAALSTLGPANLRSIALASQYSIAPLNDGQRALQLLRARAGNLQGAFEVLIAQHSVELNLGHPETALEITRRMQRLSPATRAHLRLQVLDALYDTGDSTTAALAAQQLAHAHANNLPGAPADACVLAQWMLARGDTARARALLDQLRADGNRYTPVFVGVHPVVCALLVDATLAVATKRADARARLQQLDSLVFTGITAGDAAAYAPIAVARLHQSLNQPAAALAAIRRRPFANAIWPRYLASALRLEELLASPVGVPGDTTG